MTHGIVISGKTAQYLGKAAPKVAESVRTYISDHWDELKDQYNHLSEWSLAHEKEAWIGGGIGAGALFLTWEAFKYGLYLAFKNGPAITCGVPDLSYQKWQKYFKNKNVAPAEKPPNFFREMLSVRYGPAHVINGLLMEAEYILGGIMLQAALANRATKITGLELYVTFPFFISAGWVVSQLRRGFIFYFLAKRMNYLMSPTEETCRELRMFAAEPLGEPVADEAGENSEQFSAEKTVEGLSWGMAFRSVWTYIEGLAPSFGEAGAGTTGAAFGAGIVLPGQKIFEENEKILSGFDGS